MTEKEAYLKDTKMDVVGYIRVSTADQAAEGYGLAAQSAAIESECERRDWRLKATFSDQGASGKTLDRPALTEALLLVASGEAVGLVVAKLDRLSRSVVDFATLLAWFTDSERMLLALDLGIDTSTPGGRLVANVFASVAEWEREVIAARTKEGLKAAREAGRPISGPSLVDRPELASRVRDLRSSGLTLRQICERLNSEGVPTLRGGRTWRPSSIQALFRRRDAVRSEHRIDLPVAKRL
jgi:DNA invertase Pin-like site-specific DNA recombinase